MQRPRTSHQSMVINGQIFHFGGCYHGLGGSLHGYSHDCVLQFDQFIEIYDIGSNGTISYNTTVKVNGMASSLVFPLPKSFGQERQLSLSEVETVRLVEYTEVLSMPDNELYKLQQGLISQDQYDDQVNRKFPH